MEAKPGLDDADFAHAGHEVMSPSSGPPALTYRPCDATREVRIVLLMRYRSSVSLVVMAYTGGVGTRIRSGTHEAPEEAKFERVLSACRHAGRGTVAARTFLAEPCSPGTEDTRETLKAKFLTEEASSIAAVAVTRRTRTPSSPVAPG